jgi:hypothetical protein
MAGTSNSAQGRPKRTNRRLPPATIDVPTFTNIKPVAGQTEVQASPWLFGMHPAIYAALILALASAGWFVRHTRKAQIARITTGENLREQQVFARQLLPVSGERRAALRVAARRLRKPRPSERRYLDINASTRATASRGGVFSPVHRQATAMPEYLLLVDRAGRNDQQAHWAAEMARDLAAEGVTLALYEFDRDPRWVAPLHTHRSMGLGATQTFLPLACLGARHAGQGLIVLGDGHSFIEPASGELHDWLPGALAPWPRRVLMTPRPPASWGLAEDIIAGEGQPAHVDSFLVLPAQIEMLSAAARWFDEREVPEVDLLPGAPALLPAMLEDDIGRWVGREAPAATELVALVEQLRSFLGPTAYTWLAASAAYPYLSADLTAYLAHQLSEAPPSAARSGAASSDARLLEARLVGIAQLPWCRLGMMPDWVRRALFLSLAPATRERVRAVLSRLFRAAGQDDIALGVSLGAVASGGAAPTRRQPLSLLRSFARRIGLAGVVANEPPDSPLARRDLPRRPARRLRRRAHPRRRGRLRPRRTFRDGPAADPQPLALAGGARRRGVLPGDLAEMVGQWTAAGRGSGTGPGLRAGVAKRPMPTSNASTPSSVNGSCESAHACLARNRSHRRPNKTARGKANSAASRQAKHPARWSS